MKPRLVDREAPLAPMAFEARGEAARSWVRAYLQRSTSAPSALGVYVGDRIVVMGEGLLWADGLRWLGKEPGAQRILVPTRLALEPHAALVASALERAHPRLTFPLAVLPSESPTLEIVPLGKARPLDATQLEQWLLERHSA